MGHDARDLRAWNLTRDQESHNLLLVVHKVEEGRRPLDDGDMEDDDPEEDSNVLDAENMLLPVVEENSGDDEEPISPVPSRPESPNLSPAEESSPKCSNSQSVTDSPNIARAKCISI